MDYKKFAIQHVNDDHLPALKMIFKKHYTDSYQTIKLHDFDLENMDILADGLKHIFIPFPKKLSSLEEFKNIFIEMFRSASEGFDLDIVKDNLINFISKYNTIMMATIHDDQPVLSSALLIRSHNKHYIYISEIAEHYQALKQNPNKVKIMWIQSEETATSPISMIKATFQATAKFIESNELKTRILENVMQKIGTHGGISQIAKMNDFHLVELELGSGRFVQGFGQVYDVNPDFTIRKHLNQMPHHFSNKDQN